MTAATTRHLFILTGASRGMGHAMAGQLLAPGHTVLTLARRPDEALASRAAAAGATLTQWSADLADAAPVAARLADWLAAHDGAAFASSALINNAGVIPAIVPLRDAAPADLANALRVGLEAPMQLTAAFLHATRAWPGVRKVLNISSGLAGAPWPRRPPTARPRRAWTTSPAAWRWTRRWCQTAPASVRWRRA